ncbi:hypothetical protein Ppa06_05210 [Planomonospora parontospora subsp. parontospora]|uniref:Uncharacterized protein n=2 Tax=Planomonospora parontospora TaxID=58119 RepID=A0AA37BC39_9ACTN|nr:hypothetical protein GCM10010126_05220 [Planomonospora parontospora]GII06723.1 hypothetical protein Ppa06_05210 [Planomonospora parontospora subsp. parontospora]
MARPPSPGVRATGASGAGGENAGEGCGCPAPAGRENAGEGHEDARGRGAGALRGASPRGGLWRRVELPRLRTFSTRPPAGVAVTHRNPTGADSAKICAARPDFFGRRPQGASRSMQVSREVHTRRPCSSVISMS